MVTNQTRISNLREGSISNTARNMYKNHCLKIQINRDWLFTTKKYTKKDSTFRTKETKRIVN